LQREAEAIIDDKQIDMDMGIEDDGLEEMVGDFEDLGNSGNGFHFGAVASKSKNRPSIGGLDLNSIRPLGNLGSSGKGGFHNHAGASYGKKIGFNDNDLDELEA